jgi:hypothetical protein
VLFRLHTNLRHPSGSTQVEQQVSVGWLSFAVMGFWALCDSMYMDSLRMCVVITVAMIILLRYLGPYGIIFYSRKFRSWGNLVRDILIGLRAEIET